MKILITGGAGFIGSHIAETCLHFGHEVVVVDNLTQGRKEYVHKDAYFYQVDICSHELEAVFEKERPQYVIHHAAQISVQKSMTDPLQDLTINTLGTVNVLNLCVKYGVEKIIYASSAAIYGKPNDLPIDENHPVQPLSFYGASKFTPEHYIRVYANMYPLRYTILRYANVYGPRQDPKGEGGVVSIFTDKVLKKSSPSIFGNGNQTRDFIYVKDVARANLQALSRGDNEIINISSNTQTSIHELLQLINDMMHENIQAIYKSPRSGDIIHSYLDNSKAKACLGWDIHYSLQEGLEETIESLTGVNV